MSKSVELAVAIVELLNSHEEYSQSFEAVRRAAPLTAEELEGLKDLQVSVFTGAKKIERITRGSYQRTYRPVVSVQQYLIAHDEASELERVDQLEALVAEIEAVLEDGETLAELGFFGFDEELDRAAYNPEALRELKVFATAIVLDYSD